MANYKDLRSLFGHNELKNRTEFACLVAAETVRSEVAETPNHANRLVWAKAAFENPQAVAVPVLKVLLAASKSSTVESITGVADEALQTLVDGAVDIFADGS